MTLRQNKPWLNEDDKPYWQQSCMKCVACIPSGRHDGRCGCEKGMMATSPCTKFERSDLTEQEIVTGIGVKVEGRPDLPTTTKTGEGGLNNECS